MKFIKVIICAFLLVSMLVSLNACIPGVDMDKDGNVKIKGEDGEMVLGKASWDKQKMYGLDTPKATLDNYVTTDGGMMYTFSEMDEKDAIEYINKIKEAGFTYNSITINDFCYTGTDKDGKTVNFTYDKETRGGTIIAGQGDKPSESDTGEGAVLGGSDKKWDSSKMGGLPDPGAKINEYWTVDGDTSYTLENLDNYKDYVEKIKACGFTDNLSEAEIDGTYVFTASNSLGDTVSFTSSSEGGIITFEKGE